MLTYSERKELCLAYAKNKFEEEAESAADFNKEYSCPDLIYSTENGSLYYDTIKDNILDVNSLQGLKGSNLRFKCLDNGHVDYGFIDSSVFISESDANELIRWFRDDIGEGGSIVGANFEKSNSTRTFNISFEPKVGPVPFEWAAEKDNSSNIRLNIDSCQLENSTITLEPVFVEYENGKVVRERISRDYLPYHLGHKITEVFKEKSYQYSATLAESFYKDEVENGYWANFFKSRLENNVLTDEQLQHNAKITAEINNIDKMLENGEISERDAKRMKYYLDKPFKVDKFWCAKGVSNGIENSKCKDLYSSLEKEYDDFEL